jgi:hypothetical protein
MTRPAWAEVQLAVGGALRLAVGDRRGLGSFDATIEGFWRSFRAAVIAYPLYLVLVTLRITEAQWAEVGLARILVVETIAYVIAWTAFALLMLQLSRMFDRERHYLAFMVVYNWSQIPQTLLILFVALNRVSGVFPPAAAQFAELVASAALLVYEWYIARVALGASAPQAAFVVILDVLLGSVIFRVAVTLYGTGGF